MHIQMNKLVSLNIYVLIVSKSHRKEIYVGVKQFHHRKNTIREMWFTSPERLVILQNMHMYEIC